MSETDRDSSDGALAFPAHTLLGVAIPGADDLDRQGFPGLIYFNEVDEGGHVAAWEQPQLFCQTQCISVTSLADDHVTRDT